MLNKEYLFEVLSRVRNYDCGEYISNISRILDYYFPVRFNLKHKRPLNSIPVLYIFKIITNQAVYKPRILANGFWLEISELDTYIDKIDKLVLKYLFIDEKTLKLVEL